MSNDLETTQFIKRNEFWSSLKKGNDAMNKIITYLIDEYGNNYYFYDVSNLKGYQEDDIDILMKDKVTDNILKIEIKSDFTNYKTENFFAEYCSCERTGSEGCWTKTKSDYILYWFPNKGDVYFLPTELAQNIIKENSFRTGRAYDRFKVGLGYLIPVRKMLDYIKEHDTYKLFDVYVKVDNIVA